MTRTAAIQTIDTYTGGEFAIIGLARCNGAWSFDLLNPHTGEVVAEGNLEDYGDPFIIWL